ncbi:hypothetical protein [Brevundimonas goettingensis]|uniref:Uncharacterized protein n=1 Tax=Brevundimonas goettingensis TaxID=2774190 RepID=A0A975C6H0_9CAUL|nr:hypothetical protein [Brevundimonas goettingensis]QTC92865.1 hypothetical protein IFJ75_08485 [Brevundimonas goettingensis]
MSSTLTATFTTRREAELVVERLVQEFKLDRKAIAVQADGDESTVGETTSGGDAPSVGPGAEGREDAPVEGRIRVSVSPEAGGDPEAVRSAFAEFGGESA